MSNQLTLMQELLEDLKATKVTVKDSIEEIKDKYLQSQINLYVQHTLDAIIEAIETELLPKEQKVIEENKEMKEMLKEAISYKIPWQLYEQISKLLTKFKQNGK